MKKFSLIIENFNPEEKEALFNRISPLKTWLYKSDGLGMMNIIDSIFEENNWRQRISQESILKFNRGLDILRQSSMSQYNINKQLQRKLPSGINNATAVLENGEWHLVNKLNTNYSDLADLLSDLILKGKDSNPEKGQLIYDSIIQDPKGGLLRLKPFLKKLLLKYFPTLEDYKSHTKFAKEMSEIGERSEDRIRDILIDVGFEIKYQGGNGDFIDMLFGTDLICWNKHFGLKTIQVKSSINWDQVAYYEVDWIGEGRSGKIFDKKTKVEISFDKIPDIFTNLNKFE